MSKAPSYAQTANTQPVQAQPSQKRPVGWWDHPILTVVLALTWLLLQHSVAVVHLLSALALGLLIPRVLSPWLPLSGTGALRLLPALRLFFVVLYDIVRSNIQVAKIVLGQVDKAQPAWVRVKLDLHHPLAIHFFASIITTTPGTVSAVVDEKQHCIWVHALDCSDTLSAEANMKDRYERPLQIIFREVQAP